MCVCTFVTLWIDTRSPARILQPSDLLFWRRVVIWICGCAVNFPLQGCQVDLCRVAVQGTVSWRKRASVRTFTYLHPSQKPSFVR